MQFQFHFMVMRAPLSTKTHDLEAAPFGNGSECESQGDAASYQVLRIGDGYTSGAGNGRSRCGKLKVRGPCYADEAPVYPGAEHHRGLEQKKVLDRKCSKIAWLVK